MIVATAKQFRIVILELVEQTGVESRLPDNQVGRTVST
jgi:hypothetical protein